MIGKIMLILMPVFSTLAFAIEKTPYKIPLTLPVEKKIIEEMSAQKSTFSLWIIIIGVVILFLAWKYRSVLKELIAKKYALLKIRKKIDSQSNKKSVRVQNKISNLESDSALGKSGFKEIFSFAPVKKSRIVLIAALICNIPLVGTGYFFLGKENRVKAIIITIAGISLIGLKLNLVFILLWLYAFAHMIRSIIAR